MTENIQNIEFNIFEYVGKKSKIQFRFEYVDIKATIQLRFRFIVKKLITHIRDRNEKNLYHTRTIFFTGKYDNSKALIKTTSLDEEIGLLLDNYGDSILRLSFSYLHNMEDAEEMLQDTLIKYMNKAPEFRSEEHRKAWLLSVCANLSKNKLDYNKIRETSDLNDELIQEDREDLSFVWDAVKALPTKYRMPIHLFYQEGYQTAEISKILKVNESTIRSHLKRGRDMLKEILKEEYDFG